MSGNPNKKKIDSFDRAIPQDEYIQDILNKTRLPCRLCGSRNWELADFSLHNAAVEACSDCHNVDDQGNFTRKLDS